MDLITDQGLDALPELIRIIINSAMQAERQQYRNAAPYERTDERRRYANGFKPKTVTTRMGKIAFAVPQLNDGSFYPQTLEKGLRSERALTLALAEMYVQGVSTRKVSAITEQICGVELSSMQVSQAVAQLDEVLERWRTRPLGVTPSVLLDARYEKVRIDGQVRDADVLIAMCITADGKRTILGVSVAVSEQEVHWRQFLQGSLVRGLRGVQLITSDAHTGLQVARAASFGGVPWQRCQFHLQQNDQTYVPRQDMKAEVAVDIRAIFTPASRIEADALLSRTAQKYAKLASKLATWMETVLREGLTIFLFPAAHRQRLRTVNGLERFN